MNCICCLSNEIIPGPSGLEGHYACQSCGLVFKKNPKGNDDTGTIIKHYQYIDPHERVAKSKQHFFNSVLNRLSFKYPQEEKTILDVGCGFGYFLEIAAEKKWFVKGVEIVKSAAQNARERLGNNNIFNGYLLESKYSDDSFEAVTLWDVLIHLDEPFNDLNECFRIVKEGGTVGIRVRNVKFQRILHAVYYPLRGVAKYLGIKNPSVFHRLSYSDKSIRLLLQRVGFENIQIENSPLTVGDPYKYASLSIVTRGMKGTINIIAKTLFVVSRGKYVVGPSLLIWAEKPGPYK